MDHLHFGRAIIIVFPHVVISARACRAGPCDLQLTEVFGRTVSLGPLLIFAVLRWSSWPLHPCTRPPTRHRKPHFPGGRALLVLFILSLHHLGRVRSWLFSVQGNIPSLSASLRNRREHGVSQWLVLLGFLTWLRLEIADEFVHNPSSSEYFNRLEVCP